QYPTELALMNANAGREPAGFDVLSREPYVLRIALDGVDHGLWRAVREPQGRVAERGAELDNAARAGCGRQPAEQRAVAIRVGAAAVLLAMRMGGGADMGEGIVRARRHHPRLG